MKYYYDYRFPIGNLTIEEDGHGICGIYFGIKKLEGEKKNTELIREAALQLSQYFDGRRKKFDLKLSYYGTEFQIKVWKALQRITTITDTRSQAEKETNYNLWRL